MEKLTLEHISPYLAYGLKVKRGTKDIYKIQGADNLSVYYSDNAGFSIENCKPILRPMDLTKPITIEGKEVIPIVELANIYHKSDWELTHEGFAINEDLSEEFGIRHGCFSVMDTTYDLLSLNQLPLFKWLYANKFDLEGLIDAGLAIDADTLETNPYQ